MPVASFTMALSFHFLSLFLCLFTALPSGFLLTFFPPYTHPTLFSFSSPLTICHLSSLFKVSGFSVGFPIRHMEWGWRSWLALPDLWCCPLSSPLLLHSPSSPLLLLHLSIPSLLVRIYLLISSFLALHLLFFSSLLLCTALPPLCHPFNVLSSTLISSLFLLSVHFIYSFSFLFPSASFLFLPFSLAAFFH